MRMAEGFIAVDWGTTNRRAWRIGADGVAEADEQDGQGIVAIAPGGFAAEAAAIRARLGDLPMLCAGMAGSNRGWAGTPYLPCPTDLEAIAGAITWVGSRKLLAVAMRARNGPLIVTLKLNGMLLTDLMNR